jgi:hypothetical protein
LEKFDGDRPSSCYFNPNAVRPPGSRLLIPQLSPKISPGLAEHSQWSVIIERDSKQEQDVAVRECFSLSPVKEMSSVEIACTSGTSKVSKSLSLMRRSEC